MVELETVAALPVLRAWPVRVPQGAKMMRRGVVDDGTGRVRRAGRAVAVFRLEPLS